MNASVSYAFSPTTIISSSEVNQNFTDLVNYLNNTASPIGMIGVWAGSIATIPTGWQLCNGSGGTSDFRDRMVIAAGNAYDVGDSGGSTTKNITVTGTTNNAGSFNESPQTRKDSNELNLGHRHAFTGTKTGQDIMPPYFAKAYIQRV